MSKTPYRILAYDQKNRRWKKAGSELAVGPDQAIGAYRLRNPSQSDVLQAVLPGRPIPLPLQRRKRR